MLVDSALTIQWVKKLHGDNPEEAIAYWYFTFNETEKQSVAAMYRSLIRQLLCKLDMPEIVGRLQQYRKSNQDPDTSLLEDTLAACVQRFSNVYIIIDALDECPHGKNERENLLRSLSSFLERSLPSLHMLWTSRSEPDIEATFRGLTHPPQRLAFNLVVRKDDVEKGIAIHINNTLSTGSCREWPEDLKGLVRRALISKADGM